MTTDPLGLLCANPFDDELRLVVADLMQRLVAREVLEADSPVELLYGDGDAVLTHLGG